VLVVGGADAERLAAGPVQYTPALVPEAYVVGIESATLGDEPLPLPEKAKAIVDTGTTLIYVPISVFDAIQKVGPRMHARTAHATPQQAVGVLALDSSRSSPPHTSQHPCGFNTQTNRRSRRPSTARGSWPSRPCASRRRARTRSSTSECP
jgi:hypothetical protein